MDGESPLTSFGRAVAQIAREGASCALWLQTLGVEHEVIFREGMPVYATPHSGVNDLVSVMLNANQITEARAMTLLASLPAAPLLWEQNLSFFDDVLSRGELYGVLESAIRSRLLTLFGFDAESMARREVPSTTGVPLFRIEPARLVIDGVTSHYGDDALQRECPSMPGVVVRVRFDQISRFSDLTLSPTEMDRLSRVDGKRLAALRDEGFQEMGVIHRFVCALSLLGVVEVAESTPSEQRQHGVRSQPEGDEGMEWAVLESPPDSVVPPDLETPGPSPEELAGAGMDAGAIANADAGEGEALDEEIEEIGVVYGGGGEAVPMPERPNDADFSLAPETESPSLPVEPTPSPTRPLAPQRQTLTARVSKPAPAVDFNAKAQSRKDAKTEASLLGASAPLRLTSSPAPTPPPKPAKKVSPLFQKFPQIAEKDFFALLGVGRQFQPFELKNGLIAALKPHNINRFDQIYKDADAELGLQLVEHVATAFVTVQDAKYKAQYLAHLDSKKEEPFRLADTPGKAAVDSTIGDILMKNKVYARADAYLVRAGDANNKSAEYQFLIAKNLYLWSVEQGREMSAKVKGALENAIALNSQYYDAYLYLGYYFKQIGKNDLALRKFKEAVEVNQKGHEAASEIRLLSMRGKEEKKKSTFFGLTLGKKPEKDKGKDG